jgi:endonuclease-3 related protein
MRYPSEIRKQILDLNSALFKIYGRQGWWPTTVKKGAPPVYHKGKEGQPVSSDKAHEIVVGAILTQNTSWSNVEKAIINLTTSNLLNLKTISDCDGRLEEAIKPSGYFNQKSKRLREISSNILRAGGIKTLSGLNTDSLRELLLSWKGIGPETADSILCYAFSRPVFVVDTYTKRLFNSLQIPYSSYDDIQALVHQSIEPSAKEYGDFHARIVKVSVMKEIRLIIGGKA